MTTAEIQTALEEVKCYGCLGLSTEQMLALALERRWLLSLNPNADTSAQALLGSAGCVNCFGASLFDQLETALLQAIYLGVQV